jgi:hypothetical protein
MSKSPTVSRPRRSEPAGGDSVEVLDQLLRGAVGLVQQKAPGNPAVLLDGLEDLLFLFLAHARQLAQLAFARQLLHGGRVADLERVPDERYRLGAETLDLQQIQHRRLIFCEQLAVEPELALAEDLLNVGGHALADAGNLQQLLGLTHQLGDGSGQRLQCLRRIAVGADAERIVAAHLHQVGGLVKNGGHALVVEARHGFSVRFYSFGPDRSTRHSTLRQ